MAKKETCPDLELLLAARLVPKAPQRDGYRLKMWPAGMVTAHCGDDLVKSSDIDVKKMAVTARISTPIPDLGYDIVLGDGIDCTIHKGNPLVLLMHNPTMPIAKAEDRDGNYTVRMVGENTLATSYFFQDSPESEQAFRLIEMGALPATSVKIKPTRVKQVRGENGEGPYALIEKCRMFEYSHLTFGENPEALVIAIEKGLGGKPVVDSLRNLFLPLLPVRAPMVNGATLVKCGGSCQCAKCKGASAACVSGKIPGLLQEGYNEDQAIAIANHICGEDETGDGTDDQRPTGATIMEDPRPAGAQYGSALYEMSVALSEFAEEQAKSLEPESRDAYQGIHEHINKLLKNLADVHNVRYPDLPQLGMTTTDLNENNPAPDHESAMKFRKDSRALVRGWWSERQKIVAQAEAEPVKETVEFLTKAATHKGPWSVGHQRQAAALALKLKAPEPAKPVAVASDDWSEVEKRLQDREKSLQPFAQRAATFGA